MDAHLLQAVAAPHGEFEVADRQAENLVEPIPLLHLLLVELEVAGCGRVLEEQPGSRVVGEGFQHAAVALLRLGEVVVVFVEDAEVDQGTDARRIPGERPLVVDLGVVLVAHPIGDHAEQKQGARVAGIDGNRLLAGRSHFARAVARIGEHTGAGSPKVGRRFALRTECVESLLRLGGLAGRPHRLGGGGDARGGVVARLASRLEEFARLVVGAFGDLCESLMKESESAAIAALEGLEGVAGLAEKSLADAEFH